MIGVIKRHTTWLFVICAFTLFLLRQSLGFDYFFSLAGIVLLAAVKFQIDGYGSGLSVFERVKAKLKEIVSGGTSLLRLEKYVHLALIGIFPWKRNTPVTEAEPAKEISFQRTNDYGLVVGLLLIGSVVDIPFLHLLVYNLVPDEYRIAAHCAVVFLTVYGLVWIISDLRAIKASSHSVSDTEFRLQLGWRLSGCIPTSSILRAWKAPDSLRRWRIDNKIRRSDINLITPLDPPNVLLEIKEGTYLDFLLAKRRASKYLALYVDAPGELIERLSQSANSKAVEQ